MDYWLRLYDGAPEYSQYDENDLDDLVDAIYNYDLDYSTWGMTERHLMGGKTEDIARRGRRGHPGSENRQSNGRFVVNADLVRQNHITVNGTVYKFEYVNMGGDVWRVFLGDL